MGFAETARGKFALVTSGHCHLAVRVLTRSSLNAYAVKPTSATFFPNGNCTSNLHAIAPGELPDAQSSCLSNIAARHFSFSASRLKPGGICADSSAPADGKDPTR